MHINDIPNSGVLRIVLTAFFGARIAEVEDENGNMEKCVCIPLDRNGLKVTKKHNVSAYAFVNKTINANRFGWTHYLKLKVATKLMQKMKGLGYEIPYIGNIKPASHAYWVDPNIRRKSIFVKTEDYNGDE